MKLLFFGGGAVGAFYAWRLKLAFPTARVDVVCRSNFDAVSKKGYNIFSIMGNGKFMPDKLYKTSSEIVDDVNKCGVDYDYVFISTKVSSVKSNSADLLKGILKPRHTALVLLQNGVGIEHVYAKEYPETPILTAVLMIVISLVEQINLHHLLYTKTLIGPYYMSKAIKEEALKTQAVSGSLYKLKEVGELLYKASIDTVVLDNEVEIQAARWSKLAVNLVYGGTEVLTGCCDNGDMWSENIVDHTIACIEEIFRSGNTIFKLPFPRPYCPTIESLRKSASIKPRANVSFTRDWINGNQSELDAIFRNPLKVAKKYNVDMPRAHTMYSLMKGFKFGNNIMKPKTPYEYCTSDEEVLILPE